MVHLLRPSGIGRRRGDFLHALRGERAAETTAEDNLKALKPAFAAYESARSGNAVCLDGTRPAGWANGARFEEVGKNCQMSSFITKICGNRIDTAALSF
jgi:hypothetical protein